MTKKVPSKKTAKKTIVTKRSPKKPTSTKSTKPANQTKIVAHIDIGFGNTLYVRGEGCSELSWDKGIPLENVSSSEWSLIIKKVTGKITFKFLINDDIWAEGENLSIQAGSNSTSSPVFIW